MPRKDSFTGCEVMTMAEFLAAEGEREGREGGDILQEIMVSLDEDNQRWENEIRKNALGYLQEGIAFYKECADEGEHVPNPIELVEILTVKCSQSFKTSKALLEATCKADDGKVYKFKRCQSAYSGNNWEPPDSDEDVTWEVSE